MYRCVAGYFFYDLMVSITRYEGMVRTPLSSLVAFCGRPMGMPGPAHQCVL